VKRQDLVWRQKLLLDFHAKDGAHEVRFLVARRQWGWRKRLALPVFGALLVLDLTFLGANSTKILDGGWFPLVFGGAVYLLLTT